tara:strand:- start:139 stop:915 length:777 start_codon:yes stop_codon:yes gene_type:complete
MRITKHRLIEIIKEEIGKNYYYLGEYQPGRPTILNIDFRNLKDVGENMPGGVDPTKISELIEQAFHDNNAAYFLHSPFVKVDNRGGGGYIDPSQSKYKVFLKFDDEEQREDFKTKELDLIMQQINQAAADYEMDLRQLPLRDATTGKLFENKIKVTKAKLQKIIEEELSKILPTPTKVPIFGDQSKYLKPAISNPEVDVLEFTYKKEAFVFDGNEVYTADGSDLNVTEEFEYLKIGDKYFLDVLEKKFQEAEEEGNFN